MINSINLIPKPTKNRVTVDKDSYNGDQETIYEFKSKKITFYHL